VTPALRCANCLGALLSEFFKLLPLVIIAALLSAIGLHFYSNYWQAPPSESSIVVNPPSKPQTISGRASVVDGDTIEIRGERIRLFGIDAPESGQPCTIQGKTSLIGKDAAFALADKIGGQVVECRPRDRDRFNRPVAVCFVGGEDINGWMVTNGWALAYRYYSRDYVSQEEQASKRKVGVWQCNDFVPPWDWRRDHPRNQEPKKPSPPKPTQPKQVFYYRPGDRVGTPYQTLADCERARQVAGNVGICMMK
jgi:endonuclease YncB( thermonuclease family)